MRVLLLGVDIPLPHDGGAYTLVGDVQHALARRAADCAHQFFIFDPGGASQLPECFVRLRDKRPFERRVRDRLKYEVRRAVRAVSQRPQPEHPYFDGVREELRTQRVDCALGLTPWSWSADIPNVVPVWDLEHRRKPYFPEVSANGEWERREQGYRRVLPKAIAVYTGTESGKRQIERFYGLDPEIVRVIPFPTPSFALQAASNRGADAELPARVAGDYLFYPAKYWSHKNHVRLLQALRLLRDRHAWNIQLVCCGSDTGMLAFLRERALRLGVAGQVHFLGYVSTAQLVALYRCAFALAFVAYFGPDNLPPLEAGALGCPVIAGAIEGAEEQLGPAALYVNPDRADEIAEAVWRLKEEQGLRDRLIAAGRQRAAAYTVDHYVSDLIYLLDDLEVRFECFRQ